MAHENARAGSEPSEVPTWWVLAALALGGMAGYVAGTDASAANAPARAPMCDHPMPDSTWDVEQLWVEQCAYR